MLFAVAELLVSHPVESHYTFTLMNYRKYFQINGDKKFVKRINVSKQQLGY